MTAHFSIAPNTANSPVAVADVAVKSVTIGDGEKELRLVFFF